MFVYGICVRSASDRTIAAASIQAHDASARIVTRTGQRSIHTGYNSILAEAAALPQLEGVILLHDDVEIRDPHFEDKLRAAFRQPEVAIVGVVGGVHHRAMEWWTGQKRGYVSDNQQGVLDFGRGRWSVDTVDGLLLALSPWGARNLRFDTERYRGFHGYDADICAQTRAHNRRVMVWDLEVHHHNDPHRFYGDQRNLRAADLTWRLRWRSDAAMPKRLYWRVTRASLLVRLAIAERRARALARRSTSG